VPVAERSPKVPRSRKHRGIPGCGGAEATDALKDRAPAAEIESVEPTPATEDRTSAPVPASARVSVAACAPKIRSPVAASEIFPRAPRCRHPDARLPLGRSIPARWRSAKTRPSRSLKHSTN